MVAALLVIGGLATWTGVQGYKTSGEVKRLARDIQVARFKSILQNCLDTNEKNAALSVVVRPADRSKFPVEPDCRALAMSRTSSR